MVASFHVVTFRRRQLSVPGGRNEGIEGVRFWRRLFTARDPFAAIPADVSRLRLLQPNLREWAYFAVWDDESAVDRFLDTSAVAHAWATSGSEVWSLLLKPTHARGDWPGTKALQIGHQNGLPHSPAVFVTRLELPLRALGAMWRTAAPEIAPLVATTPGLITAIPLMDRPYLNPMTFSIWRSSDEARAFAYRAHSHTRAVQHLRRRARPLEFSSACFYPYRSQGSWKGDNPLPESPSTPKETACSSP